MKRILTHLMNTNSDDESSMDNADKMMSVTTTTNIPVITMNTPLAITKNPVVTKKSLVATTKTSVIAKIPVATTKTIAVLKTKITSVATTSMNYDNNSLILSKSSLHLMIVDIFNNSIPHIK